MIKLTRDRTKVPAAFRDPRRSKQALKLLKVDAAGKREFESTYWKGAKKQLKKESGGKCAYCEAPTENVAHGDVEHFRPKSVYWWLAYCYDNYLFSCQLCNQTFKGDSFPLGDDALRLSEPAPLPPAEATEQELIDFIKTIAPDPVDDTALENYLTDCRNEQALLINPYHDDPTEFFIWEPDSVLKIVNVKPRPGNQKAETFLNAVQQFYGLNRTELGARRWEAYRMLRALARTLQSNQLDDELIAEAKEVIRESIADNAPYAGMSRYFVNEIWKLDL